MKKIILIILSLTFILTGCSKEKSISTLEKYKLEIKNDFRNITNEVMNIDGTLELKNTDGNNFDLIAKTKDINNTKITLSFIVDIYDTKTESFLIYLDKTSISSEEYSYSFKSYFDKKDSSREYTEENIDGMFVLDFDNTEDEESLKLIKEQLKAQESLKDKTSEEIQEMLENGSLIAY